MGREQPEFEEIPREQILRELERNGVEVREVGEYSYLLKKETSRGLQEKVFVFPPLIRRRMIQELRHRYEAGLSFRPHIN